LPCIHGMDDINCPICRISNSLIPKDSLNKIKIEQNNSFIKSPFLDDFSAKNEKFENDISTRTNLLQPYLINPLPNPSLINQIPSFQNKTLEEQLNRQNLEKLDTHGITKKVPIKKGELDLK
jgi:hypothetical protein